MRVSYATGTKKVSAYHCLRNDDNISLEHVLTPLVNTLSHCYARCPRAVSLPSPLGYALRLYDRLTGALDMDGFQGLSGGGGFDGSDAVSTRSGGSDGDEYDVPINPMNPNLGMDSMYYV